LTETVKEGWVERKTEVCQRLESGWVVGVACGKHARCGGGGFGERESPVENSDVQTAAVKFQGKGEADDTGSGDADVGVVHEFSLVGWDKLLFRAIDFAGRCVDCDRQWLWK
jgi:hypothetical protein